MAIKSATYDDRSGLVNNALKAEMQRLVKIAADIKDAIAAIEDQMSNFALFVEPEKCLAVFSTRKEAEHAIDRFEQLGYEDEYYIVVTDDVPTAICGISWVNGYVDGSANSSTALTECVKSIEPFVEHLTNHSLSLHLRRLIDLQAKETNDQASH